MLPTQSIFALTLARPVIAAAGEHAHMVHLWWRLGAAAQGRAWLVQVYIDGELAAVTQDAGRRELWLTLDRGVSHRIELLGVPIENDGTIDAIWRPRPDLLQSWSPPVNDEIDAVVLRDVRLPIDTEVIVKLDGVETDRGPLWPADESRSGFGALFGLGEFGRDAITGPGLGAPGSELGMGPLGTDGTAWRWRRDGLTAGSHTLEISAVDSTGQPAALPVIVDSIHTQELPPPAQSFRIDPDFTLHWSH